MRALSDYLSVLFRKLDNSLIMIWGKTIWVYSMRWGSNARSKVANWFLLVISTDNWYFVPSQIWIEFSKTLTHGAMLSEKIFILIVFLTNNHESQNRRSSMHLPRSQKRVTLLLMFLRHKILFSGFIFNGLKYTLVLTLVGKIRKLFFS